MVDTIEVTPDPESNEGKRITWHFPGNSFQVIAERMTADGKAIDEATVEKVIEWWESVRDYD
jgi:hypothetical protein